MQKVLLLQSRPELEANDDEFRAFCRFGGLDESQVVRLQMHETQPAINLNDFSAVLMGGGPANFAYDDDHKSPEQKAFEPWLWRLFDQIVAEDKPFFGACLGLGALVTHAGGRMSFEAGESVGAVNVRLVAQDPILAHIPRNFAAFVGHKEGAKEVPASLTILAWNDTCVQMVRRGQNVYGTQFHPELDPAGLELRINTYRHAGYFAPEEADKLIAAGWQSGVDDAPTTILRAFVRLHVNRL
ncbi:MAG: glutamine amidotransferase-related protein [Sphaerimonospora mesophila]